MVEHLGENLDNVHWTPQLNPNI